jgi:hypothetical protein
MIWTEKRRKIQQVFISNKFLENLNYYAKVMIKITKLDKMAYFKLIYPTWIGSTTPLHSHIM